MTICFFPLMPYRVLPDDFETRYRSVWVDVPHSFHDPEKTRGLYHEYLDELEFAKQCGFDGLWRSSCGRSPTRGCASACIASPRPR
ncbi:MAG: hypothetical protein WED01_03875 [Candidatus Rokuibacteriota bacterium]